jgi:hypothetical protein
MGQTQWEQSLKEELEFWRQWMTEARFCQLREARLTPHRELQADFRELITAPEGALVRILDVGSGPLSTLGTVWPGRHVELCLADPLAEAYNELLIESGLPQHARVTNAHGERLSEVFVADSFDLVHSANALDHAYDPLRCLQNMVSVCKRGAWVVVISVENEAERQHYQGLHQWNCVLEGEHNIRFWNRTHNLSVGHLLQEVVQIIAHRIDHGNDLPLFIVKLQKSP